MAGCRNCNDLLFPAERLAADNFSASCFCTCRLFKDGSLSAEIMYMSGLKRRDHLFLNCIAAAAGSSLKTFCLPLRFRHSLPLAPVMSKCRNIHFLHCIAVRIDAGNFFFSRMSTVRLCQDCLLTGKIMFVVLGLCRNHFRFLTSAALTFSYSEAILIPCRLCNNIPVTPVMSERRNCLC